LIELPWRSAFNESQAKQLFQEIDQVVSGQRLRWVLAGHSRGAMWAARYAHRTHGNRLAGLALIGTTHPREVDLSHLTIPVSKVLGTDDRVAPIQASRDRSHLLPQQTKFVEIAGANHRQFGFYRWQIGDGTARISRPDQQKALTNALLELLETAPPVAR
jgi:pimeloyl-ACP methyl ester carboxylesterase